MSKKATTIELVCPSKGMRQTISFSHAERLLAMRNNGGWELANKEKFEFKENAITYRKDKGADNSSAKEGNNKESNSVSE